MAHGAVVRLHLANAELMYLRAVLTVHNEYVTLEAYRPDSFQKAEPPRWKRDQDEEGVETTPTIRAVVAYDGIVAVTLTPVPPR